MTKENFRIIAEFIASSMARIDEKPDRLPFPAPQGRLVLGWLKHRAELQRQVAETMTQTKR